MKSYWRIQRIVQIEDNVQSITTGKGETLGAAILEVNKYLEERKNEEQFNVKFKRNKKMRRRYAMLLKSSNNKIAGRLGRYECF